MMQIDPNAMNQHLGGKENNRYKRKDSIEPIVEYDVDAEYQDEEVVYDPRAEREYQEAAQERPQIQINNPQHSEDTELLPGLFESDLLSWKKQFEDVLHVTIKGQDFVFRTLQRYEYKEIISIPNSDPLMREEMICEYCVLYPQSYDFSKMANQKAGYPAVLSEMIMDHSGFTRDVQVRKL